MKKQVFTIGKRKSSKGNDGYLVTFSDCVAWYSGTRAELLDALKSGRYTLTNTDDNNFKFISTDESVEMEIAKPNATAALSALADILN